MLLVGGQGRRPSQQGPAQGGVEAAVREASSAHCRKSLSAHAEAPSRSVLDRLYDSPRAGPPRLAFTAPNAGRDATARGGRAGPASGADFIAAWLGSQRAGAAPHTAQRPARSALSRGPRGTPRSVRSYGAGLAEAGLGARPDGEALRVAVHSVTPRGIHHNVRVAAVEAGSGGPLQPGVTQLAPHGPGNAARGAPQTP